MVSYHHDHIKLQEAMTMELKQNFREWDISGLHVEDEDIPKDANVSTTFVMQFPNGLIKLGIFWKVENDMFPHSSIIAEVSKLEELQKKFPHLFELEGSLYAFA